MTRWCEIDSDGKRATHATGKRATHATDPVNANTIVRFLAGKKVDTMMVTSAMSQWTYQLAHKAHNN
jgi:hypothetical protein